MRKGGRMNVITRDHLRSWLDELAKSMTLIAPKAVEEQILYKSVRDSSEVILDFTKTDLSAKEHFIPATHSLFSVHREKQGLKLEDPPPERPRALFGLRPCDAKALRVLDALFIKEEPADPYYVERRQNTTLIGLACREMGAECFCTSVGITPDDPSDVDLMLTEVNQGYAVQIITDKGKQLLGNWLLEPVEGELPRPAMREAKVPIKDAESWPQYFDHPYWARLSDRCLSCRLCTYVCPTCRCFDVRDDLTSDGRIERLRAWDSCMAEGYRRIAGGYNPRATKQERLRNRFYCKFCYYPRDYGPIACVGCGRCIAKCPTNVDVAEVLQDLATF